MRPSSNVAMHPLLLCCCMFVSVCERVNTFMYGLVVCSCLPLLLSPRYIVLKASNRIVVVLLILLLL